MRWLNVTIIAFFRIIMYTKTSQTMGKVKDNQQKVFDECYAIYEKNGYGAVIDHVQEQQEKCNPMYMEVHDEHCCACDNDMPSLNHTCLVCGQETKPTKQQLVDEVIEELKKDFAGGDYTVLDGILSLLSNKNLIEALPEERWKEFEDLNKDYFNIKKLGWNKELQREEIQIHCGENANLFLIKTDEGFIVDVYNQDNNVDTMTIWEDDLTPSREKMIAYIMENEFGNDRDRDYDRNMAFLNSLSDEELEERYEKVKFETDHQD